MKLIHTSNLNPQAMRYDIVGSFLLPERLVSARNEYTAGAIDHRDLAIIENEMIERLVDRQIEVGLPEVTSGEFRRDHWDKDFWFGLGGIRCERVESGHLYQSVDPFTDLLRFTDRVTYNPAHPFFDDYSFLHKITDGRAVCRQTVPSPVNLYLEILSMTGGHPGHVYSEVQSLLSDIAEAYNKTIRHFYELGCRSLQFDDTACGCLCRNSYTKRLLQGGVDLIKLYDCIIDLFNRSVDGIAPDMEISLYLSGGYVIVPEWESQHSADSIMPRILSVANVGKFYLPFEIGKERQLEILRYIPAGKKVALGLADAHSPFLENVSDFRRFLVKAAEYILPANLSVSPKAGFKLSSYVSRGLTYEDQWQKLAQLKAVLDV